jgi:hypothetical protein
VPKTSDGKGTAAGAVAGAGPSLTLPDHPPGGVIGVVEAALPLTVVSTFLSLGAILSSIALVYHPTVDLTPVLASWVLNPADLRPEPVERLLFLLTLLLLPPLLYSYHRLWSRVLPKAFDGADPLLARRVTTWTMAISLGAAAMVALAGNLRDAAAFATSHPLEAGALPLTAGALWWLLSIGNGRGTPRSRLAWWCAVAAISATALLPVVFGVFGSVRDTDVFAISFNAVFHVVNEVYRGRTILVDFSHQYGLYPHFLQPVLRLTGLGLPQFTLLMTFLNLVALGAVYLFLQKAIGNRLLAAMGLLATAFFCYAANRLQLADAYFQYHPVRFLFPALSLPLVWRHLSKPAPVLSNAISVVAAMAFLWNPDSGLVVVTAWMLLRVYEELGRGNVRRAATAAGRVAATAILVVGVFCFYLRLRGGVWPDLEMLFTAPRLYWRYGFYMMPMTFPHPWLLFALVYVTGLARALTGAGGVRTRMTLYLALLGCGLFAYYQGRSLDGSLLIAGWPAFILLILFLDEALPRARQGDPAARVLWACGLLVLAAGPVFLAASTSRLAAEARDNIGSLFQAPSCALVRDADFVRSSSSPSIPVSSTWYRGPGTPPERPIQVTYAR